MISKFRSPASLLLCLILLAALGCKRQPPAATATPEPPAVQAAPSIEPVQERPMAPAVEERPAPAARALGAADYNRQGLLKSIYFDFDRHEVRPDQRPTLQANADRLKGELAKFRVVIEGHCDERGTNEYNMSLGDRRSHATRQFLVDLGIDPSRIRTIAFGEERPADQGHSEEAWSRNRRCEFLLEEG